MSNFTGKWIDENKDIITVTGAWDVLSVSYSNGRGPFQGYIVNSTLTVNFTDDAVYTGMLNDNTISWTNATKWTRA